MLNLDVHCPSSLCTWTLMQGKSSQRSYLNKECLRAAGRCSACLAEDRWLVERGGIAPAV